MRDGKVFYYPRFDIDKAHNQVRRATMQQLPQDWTKIVGFNSISKYTVAFNMFYFLQPGTTPMQFGDLFEPYLRDFDGVLNKPRGTDVPKGVIYNGGKPSIDPKKMLELQARRNDKGVAGNPDVYQQNGTWFYWVELPVDKVWTFEIDDVKANVVSPLTGLFLSMDGIAQYEQVQLELVQNPLVSMVLGTMETYNTAMSVTIEFFTIQHQRVQRGDIPVFVDGHTINTHRAVRKKLNVAVPISHYARTITL